MDDDVKAERQTPWLDQRSWTNGLVLSILLQLLADLWFLPAEVSGAMLIVSVVLLIRGFLQLADRW